jgi:coatomer subunit beta
MPTIRSCLEHRHSYVRRNAVMAIFTIFKNFDFLIPDAPELIANFLEAEQVTVLTDLLFSSLVDSI